MPKPHNAEPVLITCPGCAGVLSLLHEAGTAHTHFTCQVGHTFTLTSLLAAKEEEVEKTLWAAMAFLEHVELITKRFIEESDASGVPIDRQGMETRIRQTADQRRLLRKLIEESEPANLDPDAAKRK
jgi:hypothetical protein